MCYSVKCRIEKLGGYMAFSVKTLDDLQAYFRSVDKRAVHHAPGVNEVIFPLLGHIILYMDTSKNIEVFENGSMGNILWVHINGKRYAFRYDHRNQNIEIHEGNYKGPIVCTVDNTTSVQDLIKNFSGL